MIGTRLLGRATSASRFWLSALLYATVPLFALYLATARWTLPYHIDTATNVFTAWELADDGDVFVEDNAVLADP